MADWTGIIGLDIGGANVKGVRLDRSGNDGDRISTASAPLEVWRDPSLLADELSTLGRELDAGTCSHVALTMTAELCDSFRTKREGVEYICDTVNRVFPGLAVLALDVMSEDWVEVGETIGHPLHFAANNWMASALHAAVRHPDGLLVDVGSTTTDIIPLVGGTVRARGRTDTERLTHGELVYCGAMRSNPNTLVRMVPVRGSLCRVADERFSLLADVHLLLGNLAASDYTCPTADGRGTSAQEAHERLARLVCGDCETLSRDDVLGMARHIYEAQLNRLTRAAFQVLSALEPGSAPLTVLAAGSGDFVAEAVGKRLGLKVVPYPSATEARHRVVLPALAAASLLADRLDGRP